MPFDYDEMTETVHALLSELLRDYDERIPARGEFQDVRVGRVVHFGDPGISPPGHVELVLMHMDARLDPKFDLLRFLSVRVMKSREGGYASLTCFHGTKGALRSALEEQMADPGFILDRISELAEGLPEETDPDVWR